MSVQLRLTLCTNIVAIVVFLPVIVLTGQLSSALQSNEIVDPYFWSCLLLTGVLGCVMAWISAKQINVTSPVTHHISANAKAVCQTLIAVVYYQESKSLLWWTSILMVVAGALGYAIVRMKEESQVVPPEPENPEGKTGDLTELLQSDANKVPV